MVANETVESIFPIEKERIGKEKRKNGLFILCPLSLGKASQGNGIGCGRVFARVLKISGRIKAKISPKTTIHTQTKTSAFKL